LISMDHYDKSVQKDGEDADIRVFHISEVVIEGKKHANMDLEPFRPKADDVYMFCYTSGTTGDPKAAMLTHKNIMSAACSVFNVGGVHFNDQDCVISYLPLAHSFEKCLFVTCCTSGMAVGYYSGDPLKLLDDLKVLKPTYFPSVPRLFNRIYDKINSGVKEKSGVQ
jgi:long-chain acyl-CoA synthetase